MLSAVPKPVWHYCGTVKPADAARQAEDAILAEIRKDSGELRDVRPLRPLQKGWVLVPVVYAKVS